MQTQRSEKDKVMELLLSGQIENIDLGLVIAQSMNIEKEVKKDLRILIDWFTQYKKSTFKNSLLSLPSITKLSVANRGLMVIPAQIKYLSNLEKLDASNNKIKSLPPEIGLLTKLTQLDLSDNQLNCLPAEMGDLTNLIYLNLTRNQLKSIPSQIGNLAQLDRLYIRYNQLNSLPFEISKLTKLNSLGISHNPISLQELNSIKEWLRHCSQLRFE